MKRARTANALAGLTLLLVAAWAVLTIATRSLDASVEGAVPAIAVGFATVGWVVARHQPANPMGWVLLAAGFWSLVPTVLVLYSILDYLHHGGSWPLGRATLAGQTLFWDLGFLVGGVAFLLFPDRPLVRPWPWSLRLYAVVVALIMAAQVGAIVFILDLHHVTMNAAGDITNPGPSNPGERFIGSGIFVLLAVPFWVYWIWGQARALRRAAGERRQQLKWFMTAATIEIVALALLIPLGDVHSAAADATSGIAAFAATALPVGMGIGILRYRLYEIDRLISRTLSYAVVTGVLIGVYVGTVTLATRVLPFSSPVGVAISTLAAVALFNPLRRRIQRLVDRRFNRARYDAEATVVAFRARLRGAVDVESVHTELVTAVGAALEPVHVAVWLRRAD